MNVILYGLTVAIIGIAVVFVGLVILIVCITLLSKLIRALTDRGAAKETARKAAQEVPAAAVPTPAPVVTPEPVVEDVTDDTELIAVISAAIAAFTDSDKQLVVRRVRRVSGWNRAARAEQVYRF